MRTTVGIIGGGPSGLLLSILLDRLGIDNQVLEHRSRAHVQRRVRAGQLDHASVAFLRQAGLAGRLDRLGLPQRGMNLRWRDQTRRIDLEALSGGHSCTVYGQSALTCDLTNALAASGRSPVYGAEDIRLSDPESEPHIITYRKDGAEHRLECRFVAGCDGAHGPARRLVNGAGGGSSKRLPFSWVGVLSETPPVSPELTYAYHPRGFALWSMRSDTVSRTYLQCGADDQAEDWSDDRFWSEMQRRLGPDVDFSPGKVTERLMVRMQGYVADRMQLGNVVLAGDAGHTVPPSAAKGLNLAIADIRELSESFRKLLFEGRQDALADYAQKALKRAWAGQAFSWQMTDLLHAPPSGDPFESNLKLTRLDTLLASPEQLSLFCRDYTGAEAA
ncbi:4-hydroxybenzoate 3-monooxygenase (plasmid) [Leisingera sp. M527]|uniref:4-hydroxybenzoate 3-monooxygenase n=1 Tax=Leisingera sp. M527 TaxID=2867014 RepID=UPI0021A4E1E8|nr:4-hydroxybenzoate 3-monooxygenase [Leisingera sp. M527]UWQ35738.1 4-hydroxybenzoate 3-monooxygenase [Leisingera sp. M527]